MFLASFLLASLQWSGTAQAQVQLGSHHPLRTPKEIILTAETITGIGAVRVFDFRTGTLKHSFSEPTWQNIGAHRAVAIDRENGDLWVQDGFHDLYEYDKNYALQSVITVDVGSISSSLSMNGITGIDIHTDESGSKWIYAVGTWWSAGYSYLMKVDPATGACVSALDLKGSVSGFAALGVTVGSGPLGLGTYIYVSESHTESLGRVLRVSDTGVFALDSVGSVMTVSPGQQLGQLAVLEDGTILVGATEEGTVYASDPSQSVWSALPLCQGPYSSYHGLAAGGAFLGTMALVAGPSACNGSFYEWQVVRPFGVPPVKTLDASAGGAFGTTAGRAVLRW